MEHYSELKKITNIIVTKFKPEKIILFGSYAWGKPGPDSDVDLLIVKKTDRRRNLAQKIDMACFNRNVALDIIVDTSDHLQQRINIGDQFVSKVINQGKVLYESKTK